MTRPLLRVTIKRAFLIACAAPGGRRWPSRKSSGGQVSELPERGGSTPDGVARPGAAHRLPQILFREARGAPAFAATRCTSSRTTRPTAPAFTRGSCRSSSPRRAVGCCARPLPVVNAIRTQADSRNGRLGLPKTASRSARELGLALVPRLQNTKRFRGPADRRAAATTRSIAITRTPSCSSACAIRCSDIRTIDATANADARRQPELRHDRNVRRQAGQAGNESLAKDLPNQTVRGPSDRQAGTDKLRARGDRERYDLGGRSANVPRPCTFARRGTSAGRSIEATTSSSGARSPKACAPPVCGRARPRPFRSLRRRAGGDRARIDGRTPVVLLLLLAFGLGDWRWAGRLRRGGRPCWSWRASPFTNDMGRVRKLLALIGAIAVPDCRLRRDRRPRFAGRARRGPGPRSSTASASWHRDAGDVGRALSSSACSRRL